MFKGMNDFNNTGNFATDIGLIIKNYILKLKSHRLLIVITLDFAPPLLTPPITLRIIFESK